MGDASHASKPATGSGARRVVLIEVVEQVQRERPGGALDGSVAPLEAQPRPLDRPQPRSLLMRVPAGVAARRHRDVVTAPEREEEGLGIGESDRPAESDHQDGIGCHGVC